MKKNIFIFCLFFISTINGVAQSTKRQIKKPISAKKNITSSVQISRDEKNIVQDTLLNQAKKVNEIIYESPDEKAEYPGGLSSLHTFLSNNIQYPQSAIEENIQGKVIVSFKVCADGELCNLKIQKSLNPETDNEALRVVKRMMKWKPAKVKGLPVASYFQLPISFKLAE